MKNKLAAACALGILILASGNVYSADKDAGNHNFSTRLSGFNEVHFVTGNPTATPVEPPAIRGAISTKAKGTFRAKLREGSDVIDYDLSYEGLEGTVRQAHIHFGQRSTVGGIVVWLCQTTANMAPSSPPEVASTPICPAQGTVSGTIVPAQVLAQTAQGIAAGEFAELVRALRAGAAYANVHSSLHTPGEIRGQIRSSQENRN